MAEERENILDDRQLYMLMQIEKRVSTFEQVDLTNAQQHLQRVEQERQTAVATINQINGAIIGARIMIDQELELAGVSRKMYEAQKNGKLLTEAESDQKNEIHGGNNIIKFPRGQEDEIVSGNTDDTSGAES